MKQDKGRGVVIVNKPDYIKKCESLIHNDKFKKLSKDSTVKLEGQVQRALRKIKACLVDNEYRKLYPQGSKPAQFYTTAKFHKVPNNSTNIDDLPFRPIVSNIGSATYDTSKYLAKLLTPLTKSKYVVDSTRDLINNLKERKIPDDNSLVSFDVTSLFTNVPLETTIDIIIRKIYDDNLIHTNIKKEDMRKLLYLCTKNVHFTFNNQLYIQTDGVAMGSPLGPVLANIFMVELENNLIPQLGDKVTFWKRYVDDTIAFVKIGEVDNVLAVLNNYHPNINFTFEIESNCSIPFLDVNILRISDGTFQTSVFRKETNTDIYMHWLSFAPNVWKVGTLRSLIKRAYINSSNTSILKVELSHLKKVFIESNGYPTSLVNNIMKIEDQKYHTNINHNDLVVDMNNDNITNVKKPIMVIPYKGSRGESLVRRLNNTMNHYMPENVQPRILYNCRKLSSFFSLKDKTKVEHQHGVVYKYSCPDEDCSSTYIGETSRRIRERVIDHQRRDKNSHIMKHAEINDHAAAEIKNFEILSRNNHHYKRRKITEALYIKEMKPDLNKQELSHPLYLFR